MLHSLPANNSGGATPQKTETDIQLRDWLEMKVTNDPRAMGWFAGSEAEPRIIKAYKELLSGYEIDTDQLLKTTRVIESGEQYSGSVTIRNINYFSICAHHFLPFFGQIDITYIPGEIIIGLGKFPRLVTAYSRRFQIQEDLVKEIAEEIMTSGRARGVHVKATGRHMCMCSRGPADHTASTDTEFRMGILSI
jgi:GTP cyclohydrolase IA